ncbi:MAG: hypothetical protein OEM85_10705 [Gammaproteobacteria bacterium]|nr:hypothetical protein [Gammaproteobacteria bacterium]MDH3373833.1 hypothetical protein [Gammaproteobacteria bacterium]
MKCILLVAVGLTAAFSPADAESPYEGQELRSIKSISPKEIEALKNGEGMGFAKLAELNHFPGPKHVLDLAQELDLTPVQLAETELLFAAMQSDARVLGHELLEAEAALDRAFAENEIDSESLEDALLKIGEIGARLRFVHLDAHLRQKHLLTAVQIDLYDESRGYGRKDLDHAGHSLHHE